MSNSVRFLQGKWSLGSAPKSNPGFSPSTTSPSRSSLTRLCRLPSHGGKDASAFGAAEAGEGADAELSALVSGLDASGVSYPKPKSPRDPSARNRPKCRELVCKPANEFLCGV